MILGRFFTAIWDYLRVAATFPGVNILIGLTLYKLYLIFYIPPEGAIHMKLFTDAELAKFDGSRGPQLYLSVLGSVFDVTKGGKHYGPGGTYHAFVGKDASVSFVSGDFDLPEGDKSPNDDVLKLSTQEIYSLKLWREFYEKEYKLIGRLVGRFYDKEGRETDYYRRCMAQVAKALAEKGRAEAFKAKFPPCNIEWKADTGSRVWCTNDSGGITRPWSGVPRKLFEIGRSAFRCACVPSDNLRDANLKEYDGCDPKGSSCFYSVDEGGEL